MKIILSNDDGISCQGLISLAKELSIKNEVLVIAPDSDRSAVSHSLSIFKKFKVEQDFSISGCISYKISGTPADCIKFAKLNFKDFDANVVVSGINTANNIGSDIMYSGTVAVACEAGFLGKIAFAFSANSERLDFDEYSKYACKIIDQLLPCSNKGDVWNVNFPPCKIDEIKGVKITSLGKQLYTDRYEKVGEDEYMLVGELIDHNQNELDCDVNWIKKGYITITPISFEKSNYQKISELKKKCIKL